MEVSFDLDNYRQFMIAFRRALGVGFPAARGSADPVDAICKSGRGFRYRVDNLYLTHVRIAMGRGWQEVLRPNYAQMGLTDQTPLTGPVIRNSCEYADASGGPACAMVIVVTAEAARSQVVYQVVQQVLQGRAATWGMLSSLFGIWGKYTTYHHKRRPIQYGALGIRDYYSDPDAKNALSALQKAGFQVDA